MRIKHMRNKMLKKVRGFMTEEEKKQFMENSKSRIMGGNVTAAPQRQTFAQEKQTEDLTVKCYLCKRNRPVFAGDDDIKRLPETSMSKFLKVLRADSQKKQRYLSFLRITPKFIQACNCQYNFVHSYCLTAKII